MLASRARRPATRQKHTRTRLCFLLRGLPELLTHSRRQGCSNAAATQQKRQHRGACMFLAVRPPGTAHSLTQARPLGRRGHPTTKNTGARLVVSCAASRNRSLTHAGGAIGTPRPPPRAAFICCCAASQNRSLTHASWGVGTPRPLRQKKHRGAFSFLLRGVPELLTQSRRRGRWDAADTQQKRHRGTFMFLAARPPGTAHSLTQAGPLGRRGHPAKTKKTSVRV